MSCKPPNPTAGPGGSFETQFTFAQALTESAKLAERCLLVVSLPASDTASGSPDAADDVEVGGIRGREALDRLRNVVGRVDSSWRPASASEGFEIVRRRLFKPLSAEGFVERDKTARAFSDYYHKHAAEFPSECRGHDYERRMQSAYPIHPEIFDQLYNTWSTLVKFQRTRGVLRLMAAVIYCLWKKGDKNPLILPSTIPIDDSRVQWELTRYLSDNWLPILEKDVDGPHSLPLKIDQDQPNLGRYHAARRVARTVYLGSAPTGATQGIEDRLVTLGCGIPDESPAIFGDALRRLTSVASYLYQDGTRYWYATRPTVTRLAEDKAELLKRDPDKVYDELHRRLQADLRNAGIFARAHLFPRSGAEVSDDQEIKLVVLGPEQAYSKDAQNNAAEAAARTLLETRGNVPRIFRNTIIFAAPDRLRLQDLHEAIRKYLAWKSILQDREQLNLDPHQVRQAETQRDAADGAVLARLPETFFWVLCPTQKDPQAPVEWESLKATGTEPLAVRVTRRLKADEYLLDSIGSTTIRRDLDKIPLWPAGHVQVSQLLSHYATYLYLPRLTGPQTLLRSIASGLSLMNWMTDTFAFAESYDEATGTYRGVRSGQQVDSGLEAGLLVHPDRIPAPQEPTTAGTDQLALTSKPGVIAPSPTTSSGGSPVPTRTVLRRFYGTVKLDPTRAGRDAGKIADEILSHLAGQDGAEVTVTLEIEARLPEGASEQLVRTVMENSRTLKFQSQAFEED